MYFYRNNSIVPTNVKYTYSIMEKNISSFKNLYPFLEVFNIGTSVLGKRIPCIKFGKDLMKYFIVLQFMPMYVFISYTLFIYQKK